ncbi:uncharacterized protein LOC116259218 [Nymphaea colorata]|uniref:BHLH domain-containing protein n=1 Tax=Nymphaea colorata TaxID=210225 RepID=A0A5K1FFA9_9MAGN|nr:uncharacterized protein LOC116259218 [Nymphaea colorata]
MAECMKMKTGAGCRRIMKRGGMRKPRRIPPSRRGGLKGQPLGGGSDRGSISAKLVALQGLVAAGGRMKVETLFQETAKYILCLRTQVQILQRLVELYGGDDGGDCGGEGR